MDKFFKDLNKKLEDKKPTNIILGTTGVLVSSYAVFKFLTNLDTVKLKLFRAATSISFIKDKIQEGNKKGLTKMLNGIRIAEDDTVRRLPENGIETDVLRQRLKKLSDFEEITDGSHSGTVYMVNKEHTKLLADAYGYFIHGNPLHTSTFPVIRKFEAEVISMAKYMLGGDEKACGIVTGGGTESILMALKVYRDQARDLKSYIKTPEIICPVSAHAAFNKGCHYFGIKLIPVEIDQNSFQVDPRKVEKLINSNTILLVGSAPNYPTGTIDPITDLAALALKYKLGLHVDCCLGGFFLPFARMNSKNEIPAFDFSVEGVTSISADTHKYGLATKGSSTCLFKNAEIRKYAYFVAPKWMGGIYGTPSISGSRSGALIATCWTALMHNGKSGYLKSTNDILATMKVVRDGLKDVPEIELMGNPKAMILAFQMKDKRISNKIYGIGDCLNDEFHWELNQVMDPAGIHLCFTQMHIGKGEEFLKCFKAAVAKVLKKGNEDKYASSAGIYGQVMSIPDGAPVTDFVHKFFDSVQKVDMFNDKEN